MIRLLIGIVLASLLAYGLWEAYPLIAGPSLTVATPQAGTSYHDGVVKVEGRASRTVAFTLNGAPLLTDESGHFATTLAYPSGGSILTFVATDRFGRQITRERLIYVP